MEFDFIRAAKEAQSNGFDSMLVFMRNCGSSVTLNWGEDDGMVECSWITGGIRFTGVASGWSDACWEAIEKCLKTVDSTK